MQNITLITAIAGLAFGFLGAVLGIMNTWRTFDRDRVRLKIRPAWTFFATGEQCLSIEIINVGYVGATITEIGLTVRDKSKRFTIFPSILGGGRLPQKLEPKTAITALAQPGVESAPEIKECKRAYAKTACGCIFTGNSPALKGMISEARLK